MTLETGISFFIAIFIFVVTPGPGIFAILSRALTYGARSCLSLCFGLIAGDIVYLISACLGLSVIVSKYAILFIIIKVLGTLYLFFLGYKMITSKTNIPKKTEENKAIKLLRKTTQGFIQGFLISISNPKVIIFYIAFLPTFLDIKSLDYLGIIIVCIICAFAAFCAGFGIACTVSYSRKFFNSENSMRKLNISSGIIMIAASIYLGSTLIT